MASSKPGNERIALISVSDKTGVVELAQALIRHGFRLLSTGGTAALLARSGLAVTEVSDHTGLAEMLDGRVKTLHPTIHGGLLARRELPEHMSTLAEQGIPPIDLLAVNLYPFEQTVARPGCTLEEAIENIDIGGPAMLRSAAKNWRGVTVLTDPGQYAAVIEELDQHQGRIGEATRFALSVAAFNRVSNYDGAISDYLSSITPDGGHAEFSGQANGRFVKMQDLRYGENPHQRAALYRDLNPAPGSLVTARQIQGKELSYNNLADADAAWECVKSFDGCACVIVKHANPCGVAIAMQPAEAYAKAFKTDPVSAFGGIIAFNQPVDGDTARAVSKQFLEVLIAPAYSAEALEVLAARANVRVLEIPLAGVKRDPGGPEPAASPWELGHNAHEIKRIGSGLLIQTADNRVLAESELKVATRKAPTPQQIADLLFAWKVARFVKSNAIVFVGDGMTLGIGAGQPSRLDSARIASFKAESAGLSLKGSAVASDAFFPFRDGLDVVVAAGATSVIQPGGSMRDAEVIGAADEHGIAMVLSGVRHFRH